MPKGTPKNLPAPIENEEEKKTGFAGDQILETFLEKLPTAERVAIGRFNEQTGRYQHRYSCNPDAIGILEDFLQRKFGGGIYELRLCDGAGRTISKRGGIEIGDLPEDERPPAAPAALVPIEKPTTRDDVIELMRAEANRNHELMLEMIRSRQGDGGGGSITELVTALAQMKKLEPAPQAPASADQIFLKGIEFATKATKTTTGEPAGDGGLMSLLKDVFELAKPMLAGAIPPAARPAVASAQPEEGEEMLLDIGPALAFLKYQCRQKRSIDSVAEIITMQMEGNPDYTDLIVHTAGQPVENFLALDPEFETEPYKSWCAALHAELRRRLIPATAAQG
jgi:hypothetical protein